MSLLLPYKAPLPFDLHHLVHTSHEALPEVLVHRGDLALVVDELPSELDGEGVLYSGLVVHVVTSVTCRWVCGQGGRIRFYLPQEVARSK